MPKHQNPFADIPPITDFESCQRVRPMIYRALGGTLGAWGRCGNAACARARSCQGSGQACVAAFMQAMPDDLRRMLRYALESRSAGLDLGEAVARAEARVEAASRAFGSEAG